MNKLAKVFVPLLLAAGAWSAYAEEAKTAEPAADANTTQEPKIIEVAEMKYIGMAVTHTPGDGSKDIPNLWGKFVPRSGEIKDRVGPALGVAGDFDEKTGKASYIAAAQVKNFDHVPEGMVKGTVPAGTYAEFKHKGPIATFGKTVTYIHGVWLPKSGYKNKGAMIEVYPKDQDVDAKDFEMTVLLPVSK